jgi:hypothetical protein
MGTHGLRARGGVKRLTAGRRGGGRRVLFVASIGLLPALAGCSSFSPSSASNAAGPPNNSSVVGGQSAAPSGYPPAVATAAAPPPAPHYAPATLTDPGPRGYLSVAGAAESAPSTEDTGPSGLLVALFKSTSTPPAGSANMPHPPSTYTASAPPYTPPPAQPAAPAPPPTSSAQ